MWPSKGVFGVIDCQNCKSCCPESNHSSHACGGWCSHVQHWELKHIPAPTTVRQRRCQSPGFWSERWGFRGPTPPWRRRPFPPGRQGRMPGSGTGSQCTTLWSVPAHGKQKNPCSKNWLSSGSRWNRFRTLTGFKHVVHIEYISLDNF